MKDLINKIKTDKVTAIVYTFSFVILAIIVISITYAYFEAQTLDAAIGNVDAKFSSLDEYLITSNGNLNLVVTPTTLPENGNNQEVTATAQVSLKRNPDTTNTATRTYYVYLRINNNTFTRTNPSKPEILFNAYLNNQEVTITGLTQVTEGTVTGYDITEQTGLIEIIAPQAIASSSSDTATVQNWEFKLTYLNLDTDQSANIGAIFSANVLIKNEEYTAFTGTIYRNNTITAFNNHPIEDELVAAWCYENNGTPDCARPYATQQICEYLGDTCSEDSVTVGVGTYETNVNTIRTNYNFYLKHEVEDDIIEDTKACLYYNNNEFCLGPNYWVETGNGDAHHRSNENGVATKNKLQTAMENALGTQADSCGSSSSGAHCNFGSFSCSAGADFGVSCYEGTGGCIVYDDGTSLCVWK